MDYWGVGYNKTLEYILKMDKRDTIYVYGQNPPCKTNSLMLPETDRKRLFIVEYIDQPDYFITNYRGHPNDYDAIELEEINSFTLLNSKIYTIFKFKK